jgi:hypothetical protein
VSATPANEILRPSRPPTGPERRPMVGWYDPEPLVATGFKVLVSTVFGRHFDNRLLEALATGGGEEWFDYSKDASGAERRTLWLDYLADTGDGFDSTYAVAYWATRPTLAVGSHETRPGDVLVLGGDLVYPFANHPDYIARLVRPFEAARNYSREPAPDVFAIPGNHDWYDSLVSFTRLFCSGRWFQGWRTRQKRSYFALKLPHRVWVIGLDVQLGSDVDALQIQYFRKVAESIEEDARVIVCTAEPHWVYATAYNRIDPEYNENNLRYVEKVLTRGGAKIVAHVAGDLHHYRRHEGPLGAQKITSGGGGAFLHPTHAPRARSLDGGFELRAAFPDEATSRRLAWKNLLFPFVNPKFIPAMGALYGLLGYYWIQGEMRLLGPILMMAGFILFTDTHETWYRRIAGGLHGLAHSGVAWALYAVARGLVGRLELTHELARESFTGAFMFATGGLLGSFVFGLYLLISVNVFGRHSNEAFSSLRIADFKNFLRLHVREDGTLAIFPIGLRRVARRAGCDALRRAARTRRSAGDGARADRGARGDPPPLSGGCEGARRGQAPVSSSRRTERRNSRTASRSSGPIWTNSMPYWPGAASRATWPRPETTLVSERRRSKASSSPSRRGSGALRSIPPGLRFSADPSTPDCARTENFTGIRACWRDGTATSFEKRSSQPGPGGRRKTAFAPASSHSRSHDSAPRTRTPIDLSRVEGSCRSARMVSMAFGKFSSTRMTWTPRLAAIMLASFTLAAR